MKRLHCYQLCILSATVRDPRQRKKLQAEHLGVLLRRLLLFQHADPPSALILIGYSIR